MLDGSITILRPMCGAYVILLFPLELHLRVFKATQSYMEKREKSINSF